MSTIFNFSFLYTMIHVTVISSVTHSMLMNVKCIKCRNIWITTIYLGKCETNIISNILSAPIHILYLTKSLINSSPPNNHEYLISSFIPIAWEITTTIYLIVDYSILLPRMSSFLDSTTLLFINIKPISTLLSTKKHDLIFLAGKCVCYIQKWEKL